MTDIFERYELKYKITSKQKKQILQGIAPYMSLDRYGRTTIRNLYFDTDTFRLIRRSIERPAYKEKLRVRSYSQAEAQTPVFVELKKKYNGIVYKRRIALPERQAMAWLTGEGVCPQDCQIGKEIDYFLSYYRDLRPAVFLSYEREAYFQRDGGDLRITFDENVLCRETNLSLRSPVYGQHVLSPGDTLMEIKCSGGLPLWVTSLLSEGHIYKTSFSKYGTAYQNLLYPSTKEVRRYA